MSLTSESMGPADIAAVCGNGYGNNGYNNGGMFGNEWAWIVILLLFGWGRNGFGGFGGGYGNGNGCGAPCATQEDVRAAVDQQTLISKIDQQTYGLADSFTALNNTLNNNFRGIDNAICTLGYQGAQHASNLAAQMAQCCCDTRAAIKDVDVGIERAGWNLSKQISDGFCNEEKMNMQNRFDAQAYNCNTLQAIDKLGDRIIDHLNAEKAQALRDENQALRLAASQAKQNQYLIDQIKPCPVPAYITCNPYAASYGYGYGYNNGCGCNSGCGCNGTF